VRPLINDGARWILGRILLFWGGVSTLITRLRVARHYRRCGALQESLGITPETPILTHGPELQAHIEAAAQDGCQWAQTSGSSGTPKRIPYPKRRITALRLSFMAAFVRCFWALKVKRTVFYAFANDNSDNSLTSLLSSERDKLPAAAVLQAPYRTHSLPAIRALEERYSRDAIRLWIITLSNPGVLYATNPSTIALFLERLESDWKEVTALVRDYTNRPDSIEKGALRIGLRLKSRGADQRLQSLASSDKPMSILEAAPAISHYFCWDGGYVKPYLERLHKLLPADRVTHCPMYSISTESVETLPLFVGGEVAFLPIASEVLPEYLDHDGQLFPRDKLVSGMEVTLVVSDPWGLKRYNTEDLFLVKRLIKGVPDLRFLRRVGLTYSFTGEKLTADHARRAIAELIETRPECSDVTWLTLVPEASPKPHYKLLFANNGTILPPDDAARLVDEALCTQNEEYAAKRASGRLGAVVTSVMPFDEAVVKVGGQPPGSSWEGQFKFLPLSVTSG
jgi:hypothetical protein